MLLVMFYRNQIALLVAGRVAFELGLSTFKGSVTYLMRCVESIKTRTISITSDNTAPPSLKRFSVAGRKPGFATQNKTKNKLN